MNNILRDISIVYAFFHTLIMFAALFESRYSRKKTLALTLSTMLPLIVVNILIVFLVPSTGYTLLLLTCVVPSLVFFWFIAKHRGGRYLFTFCLADTLWLEILYITAILDYYMGGTQVFMLISRLVLYPLMEFVLWKFIRPVYLEVQNSISKGWYIFSTISAIFYVLSLFTCFYPDIITNRPEYIPPFLLLLILIPTIYLHIFSTLLYQLRHHDTVQRENILTLQVEHLRARLDQFAVSNERFKEERHDFRHKLRTLATLAEKGELDELKKLSGEFADTIYDPQAERYCDAKVIDAVLSSYLYWAKVKGVSVSTRISLPDPVPVNETELATVLANAIENAINACEKQPEGKRSLEIQILNAPCFMLQVKNSFDGVIAFDDKGIPISPNNDHGFGTRSIVAFCKKNRASYDFKADEKYFYLRIVFNNRPD